ncbi:hypothetical protein PQX77_016121 [Marasmius sp. AFHP31]|nr:hypothetical protein PQX77_016121 [Marasmius sp. AFHP31]
MPRNTSVEGVIAPQNRKPLEDTRERTGQFRKGGRRKDGEKGMGTSKVHDREVYSTHSRGPSFAGSKSPLAPESLRITICLPNLADTPHDTDSTSITHQSPSDDSSSSVGDWYPTTDASVWFDSSFDSSSMSSSWASIAEEEHTVPLPAARRRPRFPDTCWNWLRGRCDQGYRCQYVHGDLEYDDEPSEKIIAQPPAQNKLFSNWAFTIHDHIKVRVGPGFAVESVTTGFETPWIHISGLPTEVTTDELARLLQRYGVVNDVKVCERKPPIVAAKARFSSHTEAQMANAGLDGSVHWGHILTTRLTLSTGDRRNGDAVISETAVRIRWEAPSKQGYAGYATLDKAQRAIQIAEADYHSTYISANLHVGLPAVGAHTVRFRNLPLQTQRKHMAKYAKPEDVVWEKANYHHVELASRGIQNLLQYKALEPLKFEVLPPPYRDGYVRAWAHFATPSAARDAVASLHHFNPRCTGKTRIYADHVHSLSYSIPYDRYQRAIHEADDLRASLWQRGMRSASISFFLHEHAVTVKLSAYDVKELGALKVELEKTLEGEVVCLEGQPIWDNFFHRPEGQAYLRQLEARYPPVTVVKSSRVRRLTLFGRRDRRELVSQELLQKYRGLNAGERRYLPIPGHLMGPFMGKQLGSLRRLLGTENVTIDMWNQKLCIRGNMSDFRAAQQAVDKIRMPHRTDATSCPICLGEVERPIKLLSCQHSYCRECLCNYLLAVKDNHFFPLKCLGGSAKCPTPMPLSVARDVLPIADFDALVEAAFSTHVDTHPNEFHYCPTPDCTQVYRTAPPGMVLQCPSCLVRICPRCHVEYHEGFDCPEKDGGERLFDEWAKQHGVKHCPGCKIPIERTEGCNHVTCTRCQSHICWVCMETFPRGEGIYSHMRAEHGGIGT